MKEHKSIHQMIKGQKNRILQQLALHASPNCVRIILHKLRGVHIGENTFIGKSVILDDTIPEYISIGSNVGIALNVVVLAHRRDVSVYNPDYGYNDYPLVFKKVKIMDNAQIGCGCIILPGVTIGQSSIIAAGSVVTKDIPAYSLAAGVPAKVIKRYAE